MQDKQNNMLKSKEEWVVARNQQRNWETLLQVISLRAQPLKIVGPRKVDVVKFSGVNRSVNAWKFNFEIEHAGVFRYENDELGKLVEDANGVPMLTGLNESLDLPPYISTKDSLINTYFEMQL